MKQILRDHGKILHWVGGRQLFPVRGPGAADLSFAHHGELEGRTPIGWQEFFPTLHKKGAVVLVDDEAGTAEVLAESEALRQAPDQKGPAGAERASDATQDPNRT